MIRRQVIRGVMGLVLGLFGATALWLLSTQPWGWIAFALWVVLSIVGFALWVLFGAIDYLLRETQR